MNSKKAKGLRKFARKVAEAAKQPISPTTTYKQMKKAYKEAKKER